MSTIKNQMWDELSTLIDKSQIIVLSTHINSDGDGLGSEIAFYYYLKNLKKECRIINATPLPENYKIIDPDGIVEAYSDTMIDWLLGVDLSIIFDIGDYKYSFSSNIFFGLIISLIFLFYIFQYLYFKTRLALHKYKLTNKYNKLEKGYEYFVDAMISIANKDNKKAIFSHKKMLSYLKNDPSLSLLLQAEVYKIEKKFNQLNDIYEKMIRSLELYINTINVIYLFFYVFK